MNEKPNSKGYAAQIEFLEKQQENLREEIKLLESRINTSLWAVELLATVLTLMGGPLKKILEIAISGAILYLITHLRIVP